MRRIFPAFTIIILCAPIAALAQNAQQGFVVSSCGTPGRTYTVGSYGPITVDENGYVCFNGGGGGGSEPVNVTQWDSVALGAPSAYGSSPGAVTVPGVNAYITNTPAVTQSSGPWTQNITQWDTTALGAPSAYGTPPGAVTVPGVNASSFGNYFYNVTSSTLTRPSNTTQYAQNTTVCLLASTTVCAPITIAIANTNAGQGLINRVTLLKSGSATTSASFTIWFFSAAPGVTSPSQYDDVAYSGPRTADMPNYIGSAQCNNPIATSDSSSGVWFECSLQNPNTGGALVFQALSGGTTVDALISVTATYTPASQETFKVSVSGIY